MELLIVLLLILIILVIYKEKKKRKHKYKHNIEVQEIYKGYKPKFKVKLTIEDLISYIPPKYVVNLNKIILTNSSALSRKERKQKTWSRNKKYKINECRGLYYSDKKKDKAYIKLIIDNIIDNSKVNYIPLFRDLIIAPVLFHEVGHHIHKFIKPEYREREDVADNWGDKFIGLLGLKYWFLLPVLWVIAKLFKFIKNNTKILDKYKNI
ncbi:MAG: hypothetical protein ACOCRO_07145 [Halanaerobiales bacterium]